MLNWFSTGNNVFFFWKFLKPLKNVLTALLEPWIFSSKKSKKIYHKFSYSRFFLEAMSTTKSIKINSNSSLTESKKTTIDDEDELIFRKSSDPEPYQLGNAPECVYSGWNIFIGIFLLFTTIFLA